MYVTSPMFEFNIYVEVNRAFYFTRKISLIQALAITCLLIIMCTQCAKILNKKCYYFEHKIVLCFSPKFNKEIYSLITAKKKLSQQAISLVIKKNSATRDMDHWYRVYFF